MLPSRITYSIAAVWALTLCSQAFAATPDAKAQQVAPSNAQVEELQRQIRTMQEQLDKLNAAQGPHRSRV